MDIDYLSAKVQLANMVIDYGIVRHKGDGIKILSFSASRMQEIIRLIIKIKEYDNK